MTQIPSVPPALAGLPATRRMLVLELKRRGEARAEELAEPCGVSVSAVRQLLAGLARDGLVTHREERAARGRPHHVHSLTPAAEGLFPAGSDQLAAELLAYLEEADGDLLAEVFDRRRERRVEQTRGRLSGKPLGERVDELARILDEEGYLAESRALPDGAFALVEHHCAILGVAQRHGCACSSELAFLSESLPDAEVERITHMVDGRHACEYRVRPRTGRAEPPATARSAG